MAHAQAETRNGDGLAEYSIEDLDHSPPQALDCSKFPNVDAGQLLGQSRFVAGGEGPMCEVVRESLADEVMLLQCAERVLKNGAVGTSAQGLQQLAKVEALWRPIRTRCSEVLK